MTVKESVDILVDKVLTEGACSAEIGVAIRTVAHALGFYRPDGCQDPEYVPLRHGQWEGEGDGYADGEIVLDVWHCSECGYCIDDGTDDPHMLPNYCPSCGAKMDGANNG